MQVPDELRYTEEHEWVRTDGDLVVIGITDYAQDALTDVVYVDLPGEGDTFDANEVFGTVESVKSVSELYMPLKGKVVEANERLMDEPELVNEDPYGDGWMLKVRLDDADTLDTLWDAARYREHTEG